MDELQRFHLEWCRAIAAARGGSCLAARYEGFKAKLAWRCALGHRWTAPPSAIIDKRTWCRKCGYERRARRARDETFATVRAIAEKRGGVCLSRGYEASQAKLELRCAEGHEWSAVPSSLVQGSWCSKCGDARAQRRTKEKKFKSLQAYARRRGGECLATTYVNVWTKMRWRCAEGHEWDAAGKQVGDGAWCPRCAGVAKHTLEELKGLAIGRGGECLSEDYVDAATPMRWTCAAGHKWWASASNVMHAGTWCPRCHGSLRDELTRLRRIARRHGGACLSPEYLGSEIDHVWRCRAGHEWWTAARNVVSGSWCAICRRSYGARPVLTLDDMQALAAERGGRCLSKQYFNTRTPMRWRCARSHEWETVPAAIRRGTWCPTCSHSVWGTLDGLQARALELGGRCLSAEYDNPRTPLRWECARGHRFEALAKAVKSGVWCAKCTKGPTAPREPWPKGSGQRKPLRRRDATLSSR